MGEHPPESEEVAQQKRLESIELTRLGFDVVFNRMLPAFRCHLASEDRPEDKEIVTAISGRLSGQLAGKRSNTPCETFGLGFETAREQQLLTEAVGWWAEKSGTYDAKTLKRDLVPKLTEGVAVEMETSPPPDGADNPGPLPDDAPKQVTVPVKSGELITAENALDCYAAFYDEWGQYLKRCEIARALKDRLSESFATLPDRHEGGTGWHDIPLYSTRELAVFRDAVRTVEDPDHRPRVDMAEKDNYDEVTPRLRQLRRRIKGTTPPTRV